MGQRRDLPPQVKYSNCIIALRTHQDARDAVLPCYRFHLCVTNVSNCHMTSMAWLCVLCLRVFLRLAALLA